MSPRRLPPSARKPGPDVSPEERARAAIAKEEAVAGDKVRMTFRLVLPRQHAEALSARAIREERNLEGGDRGHPGRRREGAHLTVIAWPGAPEVEVWVAIVTFAIVLRIVWSWRR